MQSESESVINKSRVQQKENENKKLSVKVSELKVANKEAQKQNKQLENINKQLQEQLSQFQTSDATDMSDKVAVMVQKLQTTWKDVRSNLQTIPLIASHMV